jgi:hypothetical protein
MLFPPTGGGEFALHCRLPSIRLPRISTPPVFWNTCTSPPTLFCSTYNIRRFSSYKMSAFTVDCATRAAPP